MSDINNDPFDAMIVKAKTVYRNPGMLDYDEFLSDFNRYKAIEKLFSRYRRKGKVELRERLIVNHMVSLSNVFGVPFTVELLFTLIEPTYYSELKTFLVYLQYLKLDFWNPAPTGVELIPLDTYITEVLELLPRGD